MILLPVDLLSWFNYPIAWGETIMKFPFIGLRVKAKRPRGREWGLLSHILVDICRRIIGFQKYPKILKP